MLAHAGLLITRMYALYERSRRVLAFFLGLAVTALAIGCVRPIR